MGILRKKRPKGETIYVEGIEATVSRAVYQKAYGMFPTIEFRVTADNGDTVVFNLELQLAGKFIQESISAFEAAVPTIPRPKFNSPFG